MISGSNKSKKHEISNKLHRKIDEKGLEITCFYIKV